MPILSPNKQLLFQKRALQPARKLSPIGFFRSSHDHRFAEQQGQRHHL
jgi:hypothetical protein